MKRSGLASFVLAIGLVLTGPLAAQGNPSALYDRAKQAIAAGSVVPERDLAPLIGVLCAPASTDDLRCAIDKIATLGAARSASPAAVKQYLLAQATPPAGK